MEDRVLTALDVDAVMEDVNGIAKDIAFKADFLRSRQISTGTRRAQR
jgi:hypothetical protein